MFSKRRFQVLATFVFLSGWTGCRIGSEPSVEVSSGSLSLVREYGGEGDGYFFAEPVDVAGSARDTLWIVDRGAHVVYRFDDPQAPPRKLGREGAGPGELRAPAGIVVDGGRVGVLDRGNGRLQWWSRDGEARSSFPLRFRETGIERLASGRILLTNPEMATRDGVAEERPYLAYVYGDTGYAGVGIGTYRPPADGEDDMVAVLGNVRSVAVGPDGKVWMARLTSPRIDAYSEDGTALDSLVRPLAFEARGFSPGFRMDEYVQQASARGSRGEVNVGAEGRHHVADAVTLSASAGRDGCTYYLTLLDRLTPDGDGMGKVAIDVVTADGELIGRHRVDDYNPSVIHVDPHGDVVLASALSATVRVYRPVRPLCTFPG